MLEEIRKHVDDLIASGVIRPSKSPWASVVVLCRRKNVKLRMCIYYRRLNQRTVRDANALPRPEDIFDRLHGDKFFS